MPPKAPASTILTYVLIAGTVLLAGALLVRDGVRSQAGAATDQTAGIGALRWGTSYPTASGYDRYAYVDVGLGDAADAAALPGTSLVYTSGTSVRDNWGSINTGVPLSEARANGWLLTTSSGAYVMNKAYGAYVPDFGSAAYQQRWIDNVSGFLAQTGADGVHIDDVIADAPSLTGGVYPSKYPNQQTWEDAQVNFVAAVSAALRAKGYYVLVQANGRKTTASGYANDSAQTTNEFFARLAPLADGVLSEYWMETPADKVNPTLRPSGTSDWYQHWDEWLGVMDTVQSRDADFFTLMYGSGSTTAGIAAMRYARASFLLGWDGSGGAVMFKTTDTSDPWNLEWTANVGQPTGDMYRVGVGWRRDFTGGTAIVNPSSSSSQTFALGATYKKADGTSVSTVTLGPTRALVLRGSGEVAVPVSQTLPVLSGTAQIGDTVTVSKGTWSGSPTTFAYQWKRCDATGSACTAITGATVAAYKLVSADLGRTVRAVVEASNSAGSGTATSAASAIVTATNVVAPVSTAPPVVSGAPMVGNVLTVSTGTWSGQPTTFTYEWQRCGSSGGGCGAIPSGTAAAYKIGDADIGHTLRATVTAWNTGGSTTATSSSSGVVAPSAPVGAFTVASSITDGATLTRPVPWEATVSGGSVSRVEFWIDGNRRWTERTAPYRFDKDDGVLDPGTMSAGSHTLALKAYATDSRTAETSLHVTVAAAAPTPAPAPAFTVASSIGDGVTLTQPVQWEATVSGATATRVEFLIDGALAWTERTAPYRYDTDSGVLDPTTLSDGAHTLGLKAYTSDSRVAESMVRVTIRAPKVAAPAPAPAPPPPPAEPVAPSTPFVVTSTIEDGDKLRGTVIWKADVKGAGVERVEFWIDDKLAWTERDAPYGFRGDRGLFDTELLGNGRDHLLVVKAYSTDGRTARVVATVKLVGR
jgi:Hypothetical glycosyl hydrolase family 15/Bacterial Ig domain